MLTRAGGRGIRVGGAGDVRVKQEAREAQGRGHKPRNASSPQKPEKHIGGAAEGQSRGLRLPHETGSCFGSLELEINTSVLL